MIGNMRRGKLSIAAVVAVAVATSLTPAWGGERGELLVSTSQAWAVRDDRRDVRHTSATRVERLAADIRRVRVWQDGRSGHVSVTLSGKAKAKSVERWKAWVYLGGVDEDVDPHIVLEMRRTTAATRVFTPSGGQIICRRPVLYSNQAHTMTVRIPFACRWGRLRVVYTTVAVERGRQAVAVDVVRHRSRLRWQS